MTNNDRPLGHLADGREETICGLSRGRIWPARREYSLKEVTCLSCLQIIERRQTHAAEVAQRALADTRAIIARLQEAAPSTLGATTTVDRSTT